MLTKLLMRWKSNQIGRNQTPPRWIIQIPSVDAVEYVANKVSQISASATGWQKKKAPGWQRKESHGMTKKRKPRGGKRERGCYSFLVIAREHGDRGDPVNAICVALRQHNWLDCFAMLAMTRESGPRGGKEKKATGWQKRVRLLFVSCHREGAWRPWRSSECDMCRVATA